MRTSCTSNRRKPFARVQVRRPHVRFTSPTSSSHHRTPAPHTTTPHPASPQTPFAIPHQTPSTIRRSSQHLANLLPMPMRVQPIHKHAQLPPTSHRSAPAAPLPSRIPSIGPTRPYRHPPVSLPRRRSPTMKPRRPPHRMPHAAIRRGSRLYTRSSLRPTPPQPLRIAAFRHQNRSHERSRRREVRTSCTNNRRKPFARVQVRRPHVRFTSPASTSSHHRTPASHTTTPHPAPRHPASAMPYPTPRTILYADSSNLQPIPPRMQPMHKHAQLPPTSPIRPSRSRRLNASHRSARPARTAIRPYRSPTAAAQL